MEQLRRRESPQLPKLHSESESQWEIAGPPTRPVSDTTESAQQTTSQNESSHTESNETTVETEASSQDYPRRERHAPNYFEPGTLEGRNVVCHMLCVIIVTSFPVRTSVQSFCIGWLLVGHLSETMTTAASL